MGKKERFNLKARNRSRVDVDDTWTKKIALDIQHRKDAYDTCNALVLPSAKRKTRSNAKTITTTRILSKKKRKELVKLLERKQKKLKRAELLEQLSKVQVSQDELKQYTSLTSIQTKGLKRHFQELRTPFAKTKSEASLSELTEATLNAVKGSKKKRLMILKEGKQAEASGDPNILGVNESGSEESELEASENEISAEQVLNDRIDAESVKVSALLKNTEDKAEATEQIVPPQPDTEKTVSNLISGVAKKKNTVVKLKETAKLATFVVLNRKPEIQAARLRLPVVAEEQVIVEAINENPVVIITGETGSGKTTQVPQFLYEAGYATEKQIGVTEPRRVAAMSMSKRVAEEMNLTSNEVSYLIRFEGNATPETKIKFMTDGVLLKEIQSDFLLEKYSVIILDEAHERSIYTDILIGLLSRIVPLRNKRGSPLKMVIMSATLRVEEFVENSRLFKVKPPVISVESRQFPVMIHFNRRTSGDYVKDAYKKAVKIHTRLPEGGILIFVTGQREVNVLVRKLRKTFPYTPKRLITCTLKKQDDNGKLKEKKNETKEAAEQMDQSYHDDSEDESCSRKAISRSKNRLKQQLQLPNINLDDYSVVPTDDTHEDLNDEQSDGNEDHLDEDEDEDEDMADIKACHRSVEPLWVLPLYSLLPGYKQARVFGPIPEGCRLCVVSTNVAETSLTIPNVKYVVDSGRCKIRMYDKITGVSTYRVCYTSQAAANQRAGRAGRTSPGHCYRLYSSAVFNDQFEKFSQSEIQRKPIDDLLLQMKVMNIDKVVNFPFPSPPDTVQLKTAERRLQILGALEQPSPNKIDAYSSRVTPLGRSVAAFPVAPRYGKMLALSHQHALLQCTVCMVAALSVQEVFVESVFAEGNSKTKWQQTRRLWAGAGNSLLLGDPMVLIRAIGAAEYAGSKGKLQAFCEEHGLRYKAVVEVRKLRQQLTNEINLNIQDLNLEISPQMNPLTDVQAKLLRQIILAGMGDHVARKVMPDEVNEDQDKNQWKYAYKTTEMDEPVFMHSASVLRKRCPDWVVYQEVYETNKIYMRGVTAIEPDWLPRFVPTLCQLGEPLTDPSPRYDEDTGKVMCTITGTFGRAGWKLPAMEIEYPLSVDGVKWFASFLLDGKIFPKLKRFVPLLLSTPGSITKSWAKIVPRTQEMTATLLSQGISTRSKLLEIWRTDEKFLLTAYQKWLPESAHAEVTLIWPPL